MVIIGIQIHSIENEKRIVDEYLQGASVNSLTVKYGYKNRKSITDKIKKHYPNRYNEIIKQGHNNRKKYSIDISKINNEFNAYLLGLLLTDGYIQDDNRFGIQLADKDCIEFISASTAKEYKTYSAKNENHKPSYRIIFSDYEQVNSLKRLGVVANKSHIVQPPQLTKEEKKFLPYIIRGIIDGDGCIYATTEGSAAFFIVTMSCDFANWIKDVLEKTLFLKNIHLFQNADGLWRIETALQTNLFKLLALVYDKPYGMMRKYNKLRKTFRDYNSGNPQFLLG